jgi:hypothetical protein
LRLEGEGEGENNQNKADPWSKRGEIFLLRQGPNGPTYICCSFCCEITVIEGKGVRLPAEGRRGNEEKGIHRWISFLFLVLFSSSPSPSSPQSDTTGDDLSTLGSGEEENGGMKRK